MPTDPLIIKATFDILINQTLPEMWKEMTTDYRSHCDQLNLIEKTVVSLREMFLEEFENAD